MLGFEKAFKSKDNLKTVNFNGPCQQSKKCLHSSKKKKTNQPKSVFVLKKKKKNKIKK